MAKAERHTHPIGFDEFLIVIIGFIVTSIAGISTGSGPKPTSLSRR
jgi:hypothetical protein